MKVLIVEDDAEQADTLAKLLDKSSQEKLSITIAHTLAEGLSKSWNLGVDVTYLDLSLHGSTVQEVIDTIRQFYPPVIVVTALDDPNQDIKLACFANGAQNFFKKPQDIKLLVPHLLSSGAAAHLRREAPKRLADGKL